MKNALCANVAVLALVSAAAQADTHLSFTPGEGAFNWDSYEAFAESHDLQGQTLTITGPWTGLDAENAEAVLAYFSEATGVEVNYSGSDSFEQDIVISARAGPRPMSPCFRSRGWPPTSRRKAT